MRRIAFIAGAVIIAFVAYILAPRTSYQPGELMAAHANLRGQCAACHRPWRGPANDRCIACHGNIEDVNPHGGFVVGADEITCLSCHVEHRGSVVDLNTSATFNCEWCHKHTSIEGVPEHKPA